MDGSEAELRFATSETPTRVFAGQDYRKRPGGLGSHRRKPPHIVAEISRQAVTRPAAGGGQRSHLRRAAEAVGVPVHRSIAG
jgi:hypothetical protein